MEKFIDMIITPTIAKDMRDERTAAMERIKELMHSPNDLTTKELAEYDDKTIRVARITHLLNEWETVCG